MRMTFRYVWKRMVRMPWASLATAALAAALCVLLSLLAATKAKQEDELERTYDAMEIRCIVTSADGVRSDGLLLSGAMDRLTYDAYGLTQYIRDLNKKVTLTVKLNDLDIEYPPSLTGITSQASAPELGKEYGVDVVFMDGYGWESMTREEPLLIVSETVMQKSNLTFGDAYPLAIQHAQYYPDWVALSKEPRPFRVIGCVMGMEEEAVFCPYAYISLLAREEGRVMYSESASFILRDNRKLEEFRAAASEHFSPPDATAGGSAYGPFALVIQDQLFQETVADLSRDIRLCGALMPAVCALCLGVGLCTGLIGVRARRRELVLMRCAGTPRRSAFALMFLEQALLGACGALLGAFGIAAAGLARVAFAAAGVCAACFSAGAAVAAWRFVSQRVMALMQEKG